MKRRSLHVEPHGLLDIARHYVRELIYGANDGIITTFAVVAGVAGGGLSLSVVLILGAANLFADGLSMAAGNYLSIRSHESVLQTQDSRIRRLFLAAGSTLSRRATSRSDRQWK